MQVCLRDIKSLFLVVDSGVYLLNRKEKKPFFFCHACSCQQSDLLIRSPPSVFKATFLLDVSTTGKKNW